MATTFVILFQGRTSSILGAYSTIEKAQAKLDSIQKPDEAYIKYVREDKSLSVYGQWIAFDGGTWTIHEVEVDGS